MSPALLFLFRIALANLDVVWFHINFRIICYSAVKNVMGTLIEIAINLQISLGRMAILTVLILPIQEHGLSFHFFESYSVFFISVYSFQCLGLSPPWLSLFLGFFVVFFLMLVVAFSWRGAHHTTCRISVPQLRTERQ